MFKTKNDLPEASRIKAIELLNARLADCKDLQTQVKQAHWNVKGPNFISLHLLFDKINDDVENDVDEIAERAVQLGGVAEGTARMVVAARIPGPARWTAVATSRRCRRPWRLSPRRRRGVSTRPTTWGTWTRPTCSPRSRAASTSGCGS